MKTKNIYEQKKETIAFHLKHFQVRQIIHTVALNSKYGVTFRAGNI